MHVNNRATYYRELLRRLKLSLTHLWDRYIQLYLIIAFMYPFDSFPANTNVFLTLAQGYGFVIFVFMFLERSYMVLIWLV